jgi:hypothetical protein
LFRLKFQNSEELEDFNKRKDKILQKTVAVKIDWTKNVVTLDSETQQTLLSFDGEKK